MTIIKFIYLLCPYCTGTIDDRIAALEEITSYVSMCISADTLIYCPILHIHGVTTALMANEGLDAWSADLHYDNWPKDLQHSNEMLKLAGEVRVFLQTGWRENCDVQAKIKLAEKLRIPVFYIELNCASDSPDDSPHYITHANPPTGENHAL